MNKTEILLKRIEKSDFLLRQIIDDYKRRLTFIKEVPGDGNGSNLDIKRNERLRIKASEYRTFISELERIESDLSALKTLEGEEVSIKHECEIIARACMGEGRDWWCGKLTKAISEYPLETHCLHMKTQLKDVIFLCNKADFQQLQLLGRCVTGELNKTWVDSMLKIVQIKAHRDNKIPAKEIKKG